MGLAPAAHGHYGGLNGTRVALGNDLDVHREYGHRNEALGPLLIEENQYGLEDFSGHADDCLPVRDRPLCASNQPIKPIISSQSLSFDLPKPIS